MKLRNLQQKLHNRAPKVTEQVRNDLAFQIGLQVEVARAKKGMTQKELAERVGTKQPSIARVESGAALPSIGFLEKIARALDAPLTVTLAPTATNSETIVVARGNGGPGIQEQESVQSQLKHLISYQYA